MDDRNFDAKAAKEWLETINSSLANVRENAGDIYPRLRAWLNENPTAEIIDIGCGEGVVTRKVLSPLHRYTGVEPSPILVQKAREQYESENVKFLQGSAYALPVPDASFDLAISVSVWHLLEDFDTAARELSRALKPGGKFHLLFAHPEAIEDWIGLGPSDVTYFHTELRITNLLSAAGLTLEPFESFRPSKIVPGRNIYIGVKGRK